MAIRGIRAHGDSGWDKVWRKPLSHGSSKRRSPDLRKESGLCVFDSRNPSALGRSVSQSIRLLINNSDAVDLSRVDVWCPHTLGIEADNHRRVAGLSISSEIENSEIACGLSLPAKLEATAL